MIRYHAYLADARRIAREQSIELFTMLHIERTETGLFYISSYVTPDTITSFHDGMEFKVTRVEDSREVKDGVW